MNSSNWRKTVLLLMFVALSLSATGCKTFNYTKEDDARERKRLAESWGRGRWGGMGGGGYYNPGIGNFNFNCGNMQGAFHFLDTARLA